MASRTSSAPCPAIGGPFLVLEPSWPSIRGRWSSTFVQPFRQRYLFEADVAGLRDLPNGHDQAPRVRLPPCDPTRFPFAAATPSVQLDACVASPIPCL